MKLTFEETSERVKFLCDCGCEWEEVCFVIDDVIRIGIFQDVCPECGLQVNEISIDETMTIDEII